MIGVLMHTELYLDTARLGQMCRGARLAEQDFCWLVSQLGSPLYLERFLTDGFESLPYRLRRRGRGLACWQGLARLGKSLGRFVHQPSGLPTYFFGQSSEMLRFAAEALCSQAHRILVTDLCWPPYLHALRHVAKERERDVCLVKLNGLVSSDVASSADVVDRVSRTYRAKGCNGVFLSDISYLGVNLPVEQLLADLDPSFAVIDGAQALHQRTVDLTKLPCDLYLAGTQKWFGAFHPLRLVFVGRERNMSSVNDVARSHLVSNYADELFRFHEEVKSSKYPPFGTTVNVSPLICAAGALKQAKQQTKAHHDHWQVLRTNAEMFVQWTAASRWQSLKVHSSLGSGIVHLLAMEEAISQGRLRRDLAKHGVVATAYDDGSLRFSMPRSYLSLQQLSLVSHALSQVRMNATERGLIPHYRSTPNPPPIPDSGKASRIEPRCTDLDALLALPPPTTRSPFPQSR